MHVAGAQGGVAGGHTHGSVEALAARVCTGFCGDNHTRVRAGGWKPAGADDKDMYRQATPDKGSHTGRQPLLHSNS